MSTLPHPPPSVFVVIPAHNRRDMTQGCLSGLAAQDYTRLSIVVTDDGSTDGTGEMIRENFPTVTCLQGDGNLWWSGATNLACHHAVDRGADLILALNDDVRLDADFISIMVKTHVQRPHAIIGALNLSQEDPPRLLFAGIADIRPWTGKYVVRGQIGQPYRHEWSGILPTRALPGRGMLIPRCVFDEIGMFDAKAFPQYAADYDFSLRAAAAGYELWVSADAAVRSPYEPRRTGQAGQPFGAFVKSFTSVRTCNYLPVLWRYSRRHTQPRWFGPIRLALNLVQIWGGYIKKRIRRP